MMRIYIATGDSFARLDPLDDSLRRWRVQTALDGQQVQCLTVDPRDGRTVYAGSQTRGVLRSTDGGATWADLRLPQPAVFSLAVSPADGALYAGCEPSMLYRLPAGQIPLTGGPAALELAVEEQAAIEQPAADELPADESTDNAWVELSGLREIPSAPTWSFPPRPWTSHVRWIAPNPRKAGLLLVGIELGGIMLTPDGGRTWLDHRPGGQRDVHALAWHPREAHIAYEAGGGGAAWSHDGGLTWRAADSGRDRNYTWALAVDPNDPFTWFISASSGPGAAHGGQHAQARIYRWRGEGPWQAISNDIENPLSAMPYALTLRGGLLLAGLSSGQIYASRDQGDTWQALELEGDPLPRVQALSLVAS